MIAAAPSSSSGSPATSTPSSATTPATPISRPTRRMPVARSAWSNQIAITATVSGRDAIRIAVSDDEKCCSPKLISGNGTTTSANAKAASAPSRPHSPLGERDGRERAQPAAKPLERPEPPGDRQKHRRREHHAPPRHERRRQLVDRELDEQVRDPPEDRDRGEQGPGASAHRGHRLP